MTYDTSKMRPRWGNVEGKGGTVLLAPAQAL